MSEGNMVLKCVHAGGDVTTLGWVGGAPPEVVFPDAFTSVDCVSIRNDNGSSVATDKVARFEKVIGCPAVALYMESPCGG